MYKQNLYKIHTEHLSSKLVKNNNRYKKFEYGYNKDLDCVIISKDGTIGEIYEIQGLKIALPLIPKKINGQELKKEEQVFIKTPKPATLKKIKSIYNFKSYNEDIKEKYYEYINK